MESFYVTAWIDGNNNGVRDKGELPLPYAAISDKAVNKDVTVSFSESGSDGMIFVYIYAPYEKALFNYPSCRLVKTVDVIPVAPPNYRPISAEPQRLKKSLSFGFIAEEGAIPPKPIPDLECQQFNLPQESYGTIGLGELITNPDESLFYGSNRFGRYTVNANKVQWFDTDQTFGNLQRIRAIEKGKDGVYWVLLSPPSEPKQRISKLQFESNKPIQTDIPAPFPIIVDIAIDPGDSVWAISLEQVARWENETASWNYFDLPEVTIFGEEHQKIPRSITLLPSGKLFVSSFLQITFGEYDELSDTMIWSVLDLPEEISSTQYIITDSHRIWFNEMSIYFDTEDQQWQHVAFHSEAAPFEEYSFWHSVVINGGAIWVRSGNKLFHVDHFDNSDWGSWPVYRGFDNIRRLSAESPTTLWVSDKDALSRCEFQIDS